MPAPTTQYDADFMIPVYKTENGEAEGVIGWMYPASGMVYASGLMSRFAGWSIVATGTGFNARQIRVAYPPAMPTRWANGIDIYARDWAITDDVARASYGWPGLSGFQIGHTGVIPFTADVNQYKEIVEMGAGPNTTYPDTIKVFNTIGPYGV